MRTADSRPAGRGSPQAWWRTSAALAFAGTALAAASGRGALAVVLALWAVVSLYGSVDHLVEPALAELAEAMPARSGVRRAAPHLDERSGHGELNGRQWRVLRLVAHGIAEDEIAELLDLDEATVRSDVVRILAVYAVERQHVSLAARVVVGTAGSDRSPRAA